MEIGERFVSYIDEGSGDPLVLLHGIPTWGYLWRDLIPSFSGNRRVLIPDLLGFGYSDRSDRFDRSIARQAEMIDAWLEKLGVERASLGFLSKASYSPFCHEYGLLRLVAN
jgi:pimeloyl-ACP methyl ester carboxylesterase